MGTLREATPARLFMAVMHRPDFDPAPLLAQLADRYGSVDFRCAPYLFGSSYYEAEMGPGLVKFFVSFAPLVPQERLAGVKRETNRAGGGRGRRLREGLQPRPRDHHPLFGHPGHDQGLRPPHLSRGGDLRGADAAVPARRSGCAPLDLPRLPDSGSARVSSRRRGAACWSRLTHLRARQLGLSEERAGHQLPEAPPPPELPPPPEKPPLDPPPDEEDDDEPPEVITMPPTVALPLLLEILAPP